MDDLFPDTAYAIALSSSADEHHDLALKISEQIESGVARLITTRAVLLEIGNALSKQRFRTAAVALLDALEQDARVEIIDLSPSLYARSLQLFRERPDKEWSLKDCISLIVMGDLHLTQALTSDHHFEQAGYRILLKQA
jgi:uncharacterized protein